MIGVITQKIDVRVDNLQRAMEKKANNKNLSFKSLYKIEKIINDHYNIRPGALQCILGNKKSYVKFNNHNVTRLVADLTDIKTKMSNPAMCGRIDKWINNAQTMLNSKEQALEKISTMTVQELQPLLIHKGNHSLIYKYNNFVIKNQIIADNALAKHQVAMCNKYSKAHGREQEAICTGKMILMPYIKGERDVTTQEAKQAIKEMLDKGFYMADAQPSNFVKTPEGDIVPVDFRLVFTLKDLKNIDLKTQKAIVDAWIIKGFLCVPPESKLTYDKPILQIDKYLQHLSPLRNTERHSRGLVTERLI